MQHAVYLIRALWDDEAKYWVATSDDVPGLATGAESVEALMVKLRVMVPELLEANDLLDPAAGGEVPIELIAQYHERVPVTA
jgi:predicted RNase H-like HicB family nuclease